MSEGHNPVAVRCEMELRITRLELAVHRLVRFVQWTVVFFRPVLFFTCGDARYIGA